MDLNEYQKVAMTTAIYPRQHCIVYPALGLAGEAGEVANKIKKVLRANEFFTTGRREEIMAELGDVLWYAAALANDLGFTLDEVASHNLNKLADRKARELIHGNGDNR